MHLNDSNAYSLTDNWAIQFDVNYTNSSNNAQVLFNASNSDNIYIAATNSTDGATYALAQGSAFANWSSKVCSATLGGQGSWQTLSLINLGGDVSFYI